METSARVRSRRRREPRIPAGSPWRRVIEYVLLAAGSLCIALSFNMLLNPNRIAAGGVTGVSTIVEHVLGVRPAYTQWLLNIPLWIAGMWLLGKRFGVKAAAGSLLLPLLVLLTASAPQLTDQPLLAALFGGVGVGLGLGLVFRGQASTGGMDAAAQLLHKYTGIGLGAAIALIDGVILVASGFVFTPERALYALLGLMATSKTIDIVQVGFNTAKVAFIISAEREKIQQAVLHKLDRGLTVLNGTGGYTGASQPVLMVVIGQREAAGLKQIVHNADPYAFVIISATTEVFGEGFKLQ